MNTSMMAQRAVQGRGVSIRLACAAFKASRNCYHYVAKMRRLPIGCCVDRQPPHLEVRVVLPVLAQRQGLRLESQACIYPAEQAQQNAHVQRFNRTVRYEMARV
ncbi:MAG: hypothetical protein MESAZ_02495 [Saezia sanguinis]